MNPHFSHLEFHVILEKLIQCAYSPYAKEKLRSLEPTMDEVLCQRAMRETTDAKNMIERFGAPPLSSMEKLDERIRLAEAGGMLSIEQLEEIAVFCVCCRRMRNYLSKDADNPLAVYASSFETLETLEIDIEECIYHGAIRDGASPLLKRLRHSILDMESRIKEKLEHILRTQKKLLSDSFYANRSGKYVVPVRKESQKQFPGTVVDASRTGGTVFMEPNSVSGIQDDLARLQMEEMLECNRILYTLSDEVAIRARSIQSNAARMAELDVLFAKAKLSLEMNAYPVSIDCNRTIDLRSARHPLLEQDCCVPLDLYLEPACTGIVITGPNTGGKTVALKTVGLLTLMAQCGLHVPCSPASHLPMRDAVYCDIGDNQSLTANLSTFSGHISNVLDIVSQMTADSLILLDELGSGTDPTEGMSIAIAILQALQTSGCTFMVTTHYPEVKDFVQHSDGMICARMAFDEKSLAPLYKLELGKAGNSCALEIARRLGMPEKLLAAAQSIAKDGSIYWKQNREGILPRRKGRLLRSKTAASSQKGIVFVMGDSVMVYPECEKGIVYQAADRAGNVIVQVKGEKKTVRHTRLQLLVPAKELYPDDYDFSIIFDTVANRKARHILSKRYDADATIVYQEGEQP